MALDSREWVHYDELAFTMKYVSSGRRQSNSGRLFVASLEQAVLAFLCAHADRSFYGVEVAGEAALSRGGVNRVLRELAKARLVETEDRGRMRFYRARLADPRVRSFKVLLNIDALSPLLDRLSRLALRVVLFGSAAEGTNIPDSDVDLLVVTNSPDRARKIVSSGGETLQAVIVTPVGLADLERNNPVFAAELKRGIELWKES
jgi:predicted nucleotidyltransferase